MTERERSTPSTTAAAFPNNHLTPPEPAAQPFFPANNLGDETRDHEDNPFIGSEIDDFARGFNEVARYHQPSNPEYQHEGHGRQEQEREYAFETPGFEVPFAPPHQPAGMDPGPLALIPKTNASAAQRTAGSRSGREVFARERQRERDRLMGEDKAEEDGSPELRGFSNASVREEGWSPPQLRPNRPRDEDIRVDPGVQRYQLVDEVPREGVQILRTPGQLRAARGPRGRSST